MKTRLFYVYDLIRFSGSCWLTSRWSRLIIDFNICILNYLISHIINEKYCDLASDRFGRRRIIMLSSLIFAIGTVVCAIGRSKSVLLIGRIFLGLAIGQ